MASGLNLNSRYQTDESPPAYLTKKKKRYYLASSNENIQMLTEHQTKELSNVLFELRSQHDKLTLDNSAKIREEADLKKKIKQIESRDKEISKYVSEKEARLTSIQSSTEIKQTKKTEEIYNKRILSGNIDKMKLEILLTNKGTNRYIEEENKFNKKISQNIISANNLKSKYNTVHMKVINQNERNEIEKKEQILQLDYYQEIIEHKSNFIESADERKKRQQMIAAKAKNNTNDQNEIVLRRQFFLLKIFNHFLALKMNKLIESNQEMEESYSIIRDICGTSKLSKICEIISEKDKVNTYKALLVEEKRKQRKELKNRLKQVEKEYMTLLNQVAIMTQSELTSKTSQIINKDNNTKEQTDLIKKESELTTQLEKCKEKQLLVGLFYHKTIENMKYLQKIYANDYEKGKLNYTESNNENPTRNLSTFESNDFFSSKPIETEENNHNQKQMDQLQEEKAINGYSHFLKSSFDAFNKLFFCYSKSDFIKAMREKGIEKHNGINNGFTSCSRNSARTLTKTSLSRPNNRSTIRNRTRKLYLTISTEDVLKKPTVGDENEEEEISFNEKKNQKDIMTNFLDEIKREKEDYIRCARRKQTLTVK